MTDQFIITAVHRAASEYWPEDGYTLHLKALILEGYKSCIVDALIELLELRKASKDELYNAANLIYFTSACGRSLSAPGVRNPRPDLPTADEPISPDQIRRLLSCALMETDRDMIENYASL